MKNKFYILYGYKLDEYNNPTILHELGQYNSTTALKLAKLEYAEEYANYVIKEDYYEDAFIPDYLYMPYIVNDDNIVNNSYNDNILSSKIVNANYTEVKANHMNNIKPIIICIVGASGSGKTTLSLHLAEWYNIPAICSYTTRPIREGETDGVEHHFVNEFNIKNSEDILAYTLYGGYHYWTTHNQVKYHPLSTYVIDKKGLDEFKNKWNDRYKIVSVLIVRNNRDNIDIDRKLRDIENPTDGEYDIVINNDFDNLDDFFNYAVDQISHVIKKVRGI